jgi:hypothetical protein
MLDSDLVWSYGMLAEGLRNVNGPEKEGLVAMRAKGHFLIRRDATSRDGLFVDNSG